jgi:hypothetical protein
MDLSLALLGIGINLAGIALQLSQYQNVWLTLVCAFVGGGCVFLGLFGRRSVAVSRLSLYDKLGSEGFGFMLLIGGFAAVVLLLLLGSAIYDLINREMDIQAAKAGISTPVATPLHRDSE